MSERPDEPAPAALRLAAPTAKPVPYGTAQTIDFSLVNTSRQRVGFVITTGSSLPSIEFGKLQRDGKDVPPGPCVLSMLTSGEFYRLELEPGGKLVFPVAFYANDALEDSPYMSCTPAPLPRGKGYSVEASISVNSDSLASRWPFTIQ